MSDERREVAGRQGEIFPGRASLGSRGRATSWNGTARRPGIAVDFQSTPIEPLALGEGCLVSPSGFQTLAFRRSEGLTKSAKATMSDERREVAGRQGEIFPGRASLGSPGRATSWNGTARRPGIAADFQSTPIEPLAL